MYRTLARGGVELYRVIMAELAVSLADFEVARSMQRTCHCLPLLNLGSATSGGKSSRLRSVLCNSVKPIFTFSNMNMKKRVVSMVVSSLRSLAPGRVVVAISRST